MWRGLEGEEEQSCSLGQIFCGFIRFSVNRLVFARTGTQGSVEESAREERDQEHGHRQLPGASLRGHHLYKLCKGSGEAEVGRGAAGPGESSPPIPGPADRARARSPS